MSENILGKLKETIENSQLKNFPTFERKREMLELSEGERNQLAQDSTYYLSDFLESKGFFYIPRIEYSATHRRLTMEFIDDMDIPVEQTRKISLIFSKIVNFADKWSDEDKEELENMDGSESAFFADSPIGFDAYDKGNFIEYELILSYCVINFATSEMPKII